MHVNIHQYGILQSVVVNADYKKMIIKHNRKDRFARQNKELYRFAFTIG